MNKNSSKPLPGESFEPPLLFPNAPARLRRGPVLDEIARREIRTFREAMDRAQKTSTLIVGYIPTDE